MKKIITICLIFMYILSFTGCDTKQSEFDIQIVVPAGQHEGFAFSHEEISPLKDKVILSNGEGLGDTEIILTSADPEKKTGYQPTYMTSGMAVEFEATQGEWYKIGVNVQNPSDKDRIVYVHVKGVAVRIE